MDIALTENQREVLHEQPDRPVNVIDPESQRRYVLLAREEYERLQALLAAEPSPASAVSGVPPGIRAAQEAYWRDLPELLKLKSGERQWVAYHRQQRIAFAATVAELYQECQRCGIPIGEFYVDRLEPRALPPWEEEVLEVQFETEQPPSPATAS
jgi:hypothetical protein